MNAAARRHVRVKICGITSPEDAAYAEEAGADAIGLIFAVSKRRVDRARAAEIVAATGPLVTTVGVFSGAPAHEVIEIVESLRLDVAQLHGVSDGEYLAEVRRRVKVLLALPYTAAASPGSVTALPADAYLIDGPKPGSGQRYDWEAVAAWRGHPRLVVAGGLDPANVAAAVAALRPYAVDVASGVESSPGVKDKGAVRRFVRQVRAAELGAPGAGPQSAGDRA